jgi:hypothetical protein
MRCLLLVAMLLTTSLGCAVDPAPVYLDKAAMLSPETCKDCHQAHYEEWSGSMHAYASKDPIFRAMNARGQRETDGELGDFCVQCHAPVALQLGLTTDGLNLDEVPDYAQGVTCFFCHSVEKVQGTHNNPLSLAEDLVMRGGYKDPTPNSAHASAYSPLLDRDNIQSADLCGSCHDIKLPNGVHLERTYAEWKDSLYAHQEPDQQQTCGNCHMAGRNDVAADVDGVPLRRVHDHKMVGVDTALLPFPQIEAQMTQVQRELDSSVFPELCVYEKDGETTIRVTLENLAAGHSWPSGAAMDRRAWVEVVAYNEADEVIFQSGVVPEGTAVSSLDDDNLWELRDRGFKKNGEEAHFFWEVETLESELLPAPSALFPWDPDYVDTHRYRDYVFESEKPVRATMRVQIRAVNLDLIDDLIASGDLDPSYRDKIPTFTLKFTNVEWRAAMSKTCIPDS